MLLSELEAREEAVSRAERARERREAADKENVRAWEELKRSCLSMVLDHSFSVQRTAETHGLHRKTVDTWVKTERQLRVGAGPADLSPVE